MSELQTMFSFDELPSVANRRSVSEESKARMLENRRYTDLTMRATAETGISFTMSQEAFNKLGLESNSLAYGNAGGKSYLIVRTGDDKATSGGLSFNKTRKSKTGKKSLSFSSGSLVDLLLKTGLVSDADSLKALSDGSFAPVFNKAAFFFTAILTPITNMEGVTAIFEIIVDEEGTAAYLEAQDKKANAGVVADSGLVQDGGLVNYGELPTTNGFILSDDDEDEDEEYDEQDEEEDEDEN